MATTMKSKPKSTGKPARKPAAKKFIYYFGKARCDGDGTMKPLLGGKGANLAAMTKIGLPVPPGFTITTEVCTYYYENGKKFPATLIADVKTAITFTSWPRRV